MTARLRLFRSPLEALVRCELTRRRVSFVAQYAIGPYRADFYLPGTTTVVECDGAAWHSRPHQRAHDRRRDAYMRGRGYRVVRLTGRDITRDARSAVDRALAAGRRRPPRSGMTEHASARARRIGEEEGDA